MRAQCRFSKHAYTQSHAHTLYTYMQHMHTHTPHTHYTHTHTHTHTHTTYHTPHTTYHIQVTAVDPDSGAGGDITYAITDATPLDSISRFNISGRTGAITLTQSLDRESTSLITLRVMARDRGVPCELGCRIITLELGRNYIGLQ